MPTDDVVTDAEAAAKGLARLIDRAYTAMLSDDDRAVIENLAGLLRHVSAANVAMANEIQHFAADAEQARDERDEARCERDEALTRAQELEDELAELRGDLAAGVAAACGGDA